MKTMRQVHLPWQQISPQTAHTHACLPLAPINAVQHHRFDTGDFGAGGVLIDDTHLLYRVVCVHCAYLQYIYRRDLEAPVVLADLEAPVVPEDLAAPVVPEGLVFITWNLTCARKRLALNDRNFQFVRLVILCY